MSNFVDAAVVDWANWDVKVRNFSRSVVRHFYTRDWAFVFI